MIRSEVVMATMAAGGAGARFDPVRIQKLLFLVDREIPRFVKGPHFDFEPYDYGPFDKDVYRELDRLSIEGEVTIDHSARYRRYVLTESGHAQGVAMLAKLPESVSSYLEEVARWCLSRTFRQLLSAIYQRYPDMAVNSIVPFAASPYPRTSHLLPTPSLLSGMARTMDFMGTLDVVHPQDERHVDALAICQDWIVTGDDLEGAMERAHSPGSFP